MKFLDNISEKFDNIGEKLSKTGKEAVNKTKELAEIAKLTLAVKEEEKKIASAHERIGREYVTRFSGAEDRILPEAFDEISASKKEIDSLNERIRVLKGITLCQKCGAEIEADVKYCVKCGAANEKDDNAVAEAPVCPKCQAPIEADQEFCVICGEQIKK
ncbi:MAG: zinc-ribbon domain-containing protein [Clostridia bacterium]|nr:zinc-ribbon domain-containing protein [Clostridia bacterium]